MFSTKLSGARALGLNPVVAGSYALAFHLLHTSWWTSPSWILDPRFPVWGASLGHLTWGGL
jgi:hypothetical protein